MKTNTLACDGYPALIPLLHSCEDFISGFEGDDSQEGIDGDDGLLAQLRRALAFYDPQSNKDNRVPCHRGGTWHNFDASGKCTDCTTVLLHTGEVREDAGVYKPIEYKQDSAQTRAALCATMGVKFTPTVQEMRDALLKTVERAQVLQKNGDDDTVAETLYIEDECSGLELCLKGGWDWEMADLPSGEALSDYCLRATSLECAEATLLAFEAFVSKRNELFAQITVLTPAELLADRKQYQHILDCNEDLSNTVRVHVCKMSGWSIAENDDGTFWTLASNEDEIFTSLADAIEWLRVRF